MQMNEDIMGDIVDGLIVDEPEAEEDLAPEAVAVKGAKSRPRRRKGRKNTDDYAQDPSTAPTQATTRSKGWRQTPLLEPNPSFQPFSTLKKNNGRRNGRMEENGWATEDATDVQDMGDFDFMGGLAKFDKHTIFNQIQAEDSVADEDRLVAHNRLPKAKPGTAGGKNLHHTENVLEGTANGVLKAKAETWKSEAEESDVEERASQRGSGSGRLSGRADSKLASNRRPISRKGSSTNSAQPVRTNSVCISSEQFLI
jgi:enhancer of mRNA-decapping protein 3